MSARLVWGSVDTTYGPLTLGVVLGDHSGVPDLAVARTRTAPATESQPVVVAAGWTTAIDLAGRLAPSVASLDTSNEQLPARVTDLVTQWSRGDLTALDEVAVWQAGGDFRQRAWAALREVEAGDVVTYGELAALAGNPNAARAAGSACATNLVAPFVPCHRVVQAGGAVGNYAYGVARKRELLASESAVGIR
jgi:methylated-DNA-[protein]-cysteine S-methyltransferase